MPSFSDETIEAWRKKRVSLPPPTSAMMDQWAEDYYDGALAVSRTLERVKKDLVDEERRLQGAMQQARESQENIKRLTAYGAAIEKWLHARSSGGG